MAVPTQGVVVHILRKRFLAPVLLWAAASAIAEQRQLVADVHGLAPLEVFQECAACPEMIVLPSGSFTMGAPLEESAEFFQRVFNPEPGEPVGWLREGPEHEVVIDLPIAMGRNEVTRAEFLACVADGGCAHTPDPRVPRLKGEVYADDPRSPVIDVSYFDMLEYVAWLNQITGTSAYRLPTEAEWEYAAHGGVDTKFGQGVSLTRGQANFAVFNRQGDRVLFNPYNDFMPVPVDMLDAANAWGLRHMAGNVKEITMTCWSNRQLDLLTSSEYLAEAQQAGSCRRVGKGGAFNGDVNYLRPASRGVFNEIYGRYFVGFRIVREM